mmetsp:Transcript_32513/g.54806  ORF Transcript_32513/g.54806 Transcript_32513/m.54806 type:complete len:243 (-) Transcript_32513:559-1287(-)
MLGNEEGINVGWRQDQLPILRDINVSECCYYFHVLRLKMEEEGVLESLKNINDMDELPWNERSPDVSASWSLPLNDGQTRRRCLAMLDMHYKILFCNQLVEVKDAQEMGLGLFTKREVTHFSELSVDAEIHMWGLFGFLEWVQLEEWERLEFHGHPSLYKDRSNMCAVIYGPIAMANSEEGRPGFTPVRPLYGQSLQAVVTTRIVEHVWDYEGMECRQFVSHNSFVGDLEVEDVNQLSPFQQ